MLNGQNLPWRAILRNANRNTFQSLYLRRIQHVSILARYSQPPIGPRSLLRHSLCVQSLYPSATRVFSTFPARGKEKPLESKPEPEEEEDDKKEKDSVATPRRSEEPVETKGKPAEPTPIPSSASSTSHDGRPSSSNGGGTESGPSGGDNVRKGRKASPERSLQKPTVPEIYPQVMAIPIAKRPLFPGFYKAVTIRDPNVASAIQEMMKRGQPYIGAFLFKDENADQDIIDSIDDVHSVGVFAQITSAFPVHGEENSLTAVLYPHRRIKMTSLIPPNRGKGAATGGKSDSSSAAEVESADSLNTREESTQEKKGDVVASFEETAIDQQSRDPTAQQYEPTSFLRKYPVSLVSVENLTEEPHDKKSPVIRAVTSEIVNVFKEVANLNPLFRDQISTFSMSQSAGNVIDEPAKLADFAAAVSAGEIKELQDVLETLSVEERLSKALVVLKKELMNAQLQSKISKDVEAKIQKRQREYWLMEQMKGIRRELGIESDGKDKLVEKFREKAEKLAMPETVKKVFDEEINKLAHLEPAASEFNVTRNYLDWLTQIPWGQRSPENFDITNTMKVLDEDHHGLKDVKDRILEFIAVGKLRGTVEGKILCFVGPPGVGKTSIGKSIARALNRQYYRFSVGGLTDVAEIKGHRRTYVGALPGRIIQALKKCQTENPLILIDEIDKIGRGHQGDPASALLELLDPEQNNSFLDHYMDVPVDLSKVLFVCTANMSDTIPRPLLDRMEMIELSGYVADEKMAIAERYLAPAAKEMSGLKDVGVRLQTDAIEELIKSYCRESGVRNLKKQIEKVFRKSALKIVQDLGESSLPEEKALTKEGKAALEEPESRSDITKTPNNIENATTETPRIGLNVPDSVHVDITKDNLKDYVGPPVFTSDRLYEVTPPGVAMGLAWTRMGGAALYVESILEASLNPSSRPGLERTGNLKSVMKESTSIAYSFAKSLMARDFPNNKFFEKARLHLHCPEGAVQKDGMSSCHRSAIVSVLLTRSKDHPLG
jgi:Lon-like ATP-dependent protease